MARTLRIVVAGAAILSLLPGAAAPQSSETREQSSEATAGPPAPAASDLAPLAPGDAIRITFWREPTLNGEYPVDEAGSVVLPLLGARSVSGVAPAQLKAQLAQDYGKELRTPADVQIVLLRRVRVLGAVKEPGLYLVDPTMTLGDAVALAGGATRDGKLSGIRIMRDGHELRTDLGETTRVVEHLRSGDQILVPERSWFARHSSLLIGATISAAAIIVSNAVIR